ncbi:hypothetical protein NDA16_001569 [Ustilago loliicola]|nr:hypothetical protein NDA16_001569 [Ustilago loliicola]
MSPPASVTIIQLEPVIFLRGQSSSGEDARGRRRPVNIDAPPSQLRALVTLYLPKPSKIKEISVSLKGTAKTDWPEGIGPNRVEMAEEMSIFEQSISLYNAKHDKATVPGTRPRSNSVGPGIGLQEDVDWEYAAATATANASANARTNARPSSSNASRQPSASSSSRKDDERPKSSGKDSASGGSNLARQIAGAAAKAGTAMIPPTLRPDMGINKSKDSSSSRNCPPLQRTGSGTTSFSQYATSPESTPATSPPATPHNPWSRTPSSAGSTSFANTPPASFFDERGPPAAATHQDLSTWHEHFESRGYERPPLYVPRSAPLQGYDSWPTEVPAERSPDQAEASTSGDQLALSPVNSSSAAPSASATPMDRTAANSTDVIAPVPAMRSNGSAGVAAGSSSAAPARSILHTQHTTTPRPKEQTVRFDPQSRVDNAPHSSSPSNGILPKPNGTKSAPSSRRGSVELQDKDKNSSKGKSSNKSNTAKKPGLKTLINGLLKEPITAASDNKAHPDDAAHAATDSKEFKKGTYTYPICISLPSNLPPTLHADFGFNRYVLRANVVRAGPLTPNLTAQREVTLIHAPDEDALEETDSIVVERCWEDLLSYMVVFSGKSFPIGQKIPLWLKFMPLGKVKIYRIIATLEERTDYFAKGRRSHGGGLDSFA